MEGQIFLAVKPARPARPRQTDGLFLMRLRKKRMDTSGTRPQNTKLSTLEHIIVSTDSMESGTAPRGAIEHQKPSGIAYSFNFLHQEARKGYIFHQSK